MFTAFYIVRSNQESPNSIAFGIFCLFSISLEIDGPGWIEFNLTNKKQNKNREKINHINWYQLHGILFLASVFLFSKINKDNIHVNVQRDGVRACVCSLQFSFQFFWHVNTFDWVPLQRKRDENCWIRMKRTEAPTISFSLFVHLRGPILFRSALLTRSNIYLFSHRFTRN